MVIIMRDKNVYEERFRTLVNILVFCKNTPFINN